MEKFQAKLEEVAAGDSAMCGVGVAHKRHRKRKGHKEAVMAKKPKGEEVMKTKKPKGDEAMKTKKPWGEKTMKTRGDEAMEMLVVDTGSEEKSGKRGKAKLPLHTEEMTTKPTGVDEAMKPKDDEAEMVVVDAGSKETGGKRRKTKLLTWRSPPPMEDVLINELIDYMVPKPPRTPSECDFTDVVFDSDLDAQIYATFKEAREYRANVLQQYRTKGYAELQLEITDEEESTYEFEGGRTYELVEV